jgi:6-phosphogluconolactonase
VTAPVTVVVHRDKAVLASAVAARLALALLDAQAARGTASVVLTGGSIGIATLAALRDNPVSDAVDWAQVDVWWGDERYVAADDPERNERQAREALLDHIPLDPVRVHPMASLEDDVDAAAQRYADALPASFDVLLLGMGPEGHIASIFPESPAAVDERRAFAVRDCPKPPPTRISLGFGAIQTAREVWLLVAGTEKSPALATALSGADQVQLPAAGARGTERTLWLLDTDAATDLAAALRP